MLADRLTAFAGAVVFEGERGGELNGLVDHLVLAGHLDAEVAKRMFGDRQFLQ